MGLAKKVMYTSAITFVASGLYSLLPDSGVMTTIQEVFFPRNNQVVNINARDYLNLGVVGTFFVSLGTALVTNFVVYNEGVRQMNEALRNRPTIAEIYRQERENRQKDNKRN